MESITHNVNDCDVIYRSDDSKVLVVNIVVPVTCHGEDKHISNFVLVSEGVIYHDVTFILRRLNSICDDFKIEHSVFSTSNLKCKGFNLPYAKDMPGLVADNEPQINAVIKTAYRSAYGDNCAAKPRFTLWGTMKNISKFIKMFGDLEADMNAMLEVVSDKLMYMLESIGLGQFITNGLTGPQPTITDGAAGSTPVIDAKMIEQVEKFVDRIFNLEARCNEKDNTIEYLVDTVKTLMDRVATLEKHQCGVLKKRAF